MTGESVPIGKFPSTSLIDCKNSNRWLCEGSNVLSAQPDSYLLAIHTGYTSRRGRIIRKILSRKQRMP